jgi:hypothetical protein
MSNEMRKELSTSSFFVIVPALLEDEVSGKAHYGDLSEMHFFSARMEARSAVM